jgi:ubiquinone/menaquinone biosynthesis C-methylase UbiE
MNSFDLVASRFERSRALPATVAAAIRQALYEHGGLNAKSPLLEVGCGTGRIGAEFCAAGDNYLGLDSSIRMLREFERKDFPQAPILVRADGGCLPFCAGVFETVLMVQLLTAQNWPPLLAEANRVLQSQGVLAIGKTKGPPDGVDAMMRDRLEKLVSGMGMSEPSSDRGAMTEWLKANSSRQLKLRPIDWVEDRTPRDFIHRKQSAARFASFPADLRETALRSLADWAERHIGPLDARFSEPYYFSLELYWFQGGAKHD